ncbi:MAG: hypothetical protein HYT79_07120 [Elusimicrobia bacterium]|nr:hypothetical protein [Elusimicrobiota bacterium]
MGYKTPWGGYSPLRHSGESRNPGPPRESNKLDTGFRRYDGKRKGSGNFWPWRRFNILLILLGLCLGLNAASPDFAEIDRLYLYRHLGSNLEESINRLQSMDAASPGNPDILWRWGRGLVKLGERQTKKKGKLIFFSLAEEKIKQALALKADNAEAHFWFGVVLGRKAETMDFLSALTLVGPMKREMMTVLSLNPRHAGAHYFLGRLILELPGGNRKKALEELEEAVKLAPNCAACYPTLAEAYLDAGDEYKARLTLRAALAIKKPDDPAEYEIDLENARKLLEDIGE